MIRKYIESGGECFFEELIEFSEIPGHDLDIVSAFDLGLFIVEEETEECLLLLVILQGLLVNPVQLVNILEHYLFVPRTVGTGVQVFLLLFAVVGLGV